MFYLFLPFLIPVVVVLFVSYYANRGRYRTSILQSRAARYVAIVILLSISLPIFITGALKKTPNWTGADMIISCILFGLALGLLFNPIVRFITAPVRLAKRLRKKFISNISTYGSTGIGTYYGKGMDSEVNGVPIKWKMRFTFKDDKGKTRKDTSIIYYKKDELEYYMTNDFAIKILGKHAVVTELPFEKTKAKIAENNTTCRYCGEKMEIKEQVCSSCGAKKLSKHS